MNDAEMNNPLPQPFKSELLVRFLSGEANAQERNEVNQWIKADKRNQKYFDELLVIWKTSTVAADFNAIYLKDDWKKVCQKIENINSRQTDKTGKQRNLFYRFARIAAAIVVCIGLYFFSTKNFQPWSDKKIIATTGVELSAITLPDGSTVDLNANSKLTYPEEFESDKRVVVLEGEAFFEVMKNPLKPFLIKTGEVTTEVVGTSFNICGKPDKVVVTVLTGKVMFYKQRNNSVVMTVGEEGIYSDNGFEKKLNDDVNFLSWKTNVLTFQNTPMSKVIMDLNRHFGKRIQLKPNSLQGCALTSKFQNQTLEDILKELSTVFSLRIENTSDTILIGGGGCR
jgi:transmembrane sensor